MRRPGSDPRADLSKLGTGRIIAEANVFERIAGDARATFEEARQALAKATETLGVYEGELLRRALTGDEVAASRFPAEVLDKAREEAGKPGIQS